MEVEEKVVEVEAEEEGEVEVEVEVEVEAEVEVEVVVRVRVEGRQAGERELNVGSLRDSKYRRGACIDTVSK